MPGAGRLQKNWNLSAVLARRWKSRSKCRLGSSLRAYRPYGHSITGACASKPGRLAAISGKGIAAALLMANLQANVRQCAIALDQPEPLLRAVNKLFYDNTSDSSYATLFFAEYNDTQRRFRYANCGHLSGLLLRGDGTVERLDSTGTVVGLFKEWDCSIGERRLQPGDILALYTDGITESFNEE